ncbi:unnamed protein product [Thlaspi arvense]|uniref:CCHC-type domain-containing protein n=1 Tax=Thlaspi arvense TaxID=13288 RepID=A0AAU9SAW5_THLAR|nr:unnamed protein product [Thlaspi arvense]
MVSSSQLLTNGEATISIPATETGVAVLDPVMALSESHNPATTLNPAMVSDSAAVIFETKPLTPFVPSLGAWVKPLKINPELKDPIPQIPPSSETPISKSHVRPSDILPPEVKEDGNLQFPWAAKMDPKNVQSPPYHFANLLGGWHTNGCDSRPCLDAGIGKSRRVYNRTVLSLLFAIRRSHPCCHQSDLGLLYSDWGISWIASGLGEPMLTNKPRLDPTQMGEAKLIVEVELDIAFPQRIAAGDQKGNVSMVSVEYSWIPFKCERCGHLGHKKSRCLLLHETKANTFDFVDSRATADIASEVVNTTTLDVPFVAPMEAANEVLSDVVAAHAAVLSTSALSCEEAEQVATHVANPIDLDYINTLENANATLLFGSPPDLVTFSTPPLSDSFANEVVQENVFGSNSALDFGATCFEMGDTSQRTNRGRPIKPTQKN